jgi:hypothetical protein
MDGPRTIVLNRQNGAFGFTLRHFIVYPPDVHDPVVAKKLATCGLANFSQPMDSVFVKKVIPESEADYAGLREGDRLIAVNNVPVSLQFQFADIVATIQKTPKTLCIQIVPKCYDILQTVSRCVFFFRLLFFSLVFVTNVKKRTCQKKKTKRKKFMCVTNSCV